MGAGAGAAAAAARGRRRQGGRRDAAAPPATPSPASQETGGRWRSWPRRRPLSAAAANELRRGGGGRRSRARRGAGGRRSPPALPAPPAPRLGAARRQPRQAGGEGPGTGCVGAGRGETGLGTGGGPPARQAGFYCGDPDGPVASQARGNRAGEARLRRVFQRGSVARCSFLSRSTLPLPSPKDDPDRATEQSLLLITAPVVASPSGEGWRGWINWI